MTSINVTPTTTQTTTYFTANGLTAEAMSNASPHQLQNMSRDLSSNISQHGQIVLGVGGLSTTQSIIRPIMSPSSSITRTIMNPVQAEGTYSLSQPSRINEYTGAQTNEYTGPSRENLTKRMKTAGEWWRDLMTPAASSALSSIVEFSGEGSRNLQDYRRKLGTITDLFFPETEEFTADVRQEVLSNCVRITLTGTALKYVDTLEPADSKHYGRLMNKLKFRFSEASNSAIALQKLDCLKQDSRSITEFQELVTSTLQRYIATNSHLQLQTAEFRESYFAAQSDVYFRKGLNSSIWSELNKRRIPEVFEMSVQECLRIENDIKAENARNQVEKNRGRVFAVAEDSKPHQQLMQNSQGTRKKKPVIPLPHSNFRNKGRGWQPKNNLPLPNNNGKWRNQGPGRRNDKWNTRNSRYTDRSRNFNRRSPYNDQRPFWVDQSRSRDQRPNYDQGMYNKEQFKSREQEEYLRQRKRDRDYEAERQKGHEEATKLALLGCTLPKNSERDDRVISTEMSNIRVEGAEAGLPPFGTETAEARVPYQSQGARARVSEAWEGENRNRK